jgi:hypothetical protein
MEEILVIFLQGLIEFLAELLIYIGIDLPWSRDNGRVGCGLTSVFLLIGAALGAIMNFVHPRLYMPSPAARIATLLLAPIAAGAISMLLARWRNKRGANLVPSNHFFTAYCFVLAFDVVRFAFGTR